MRAVPIGTRVVWTGDKFARIGDGDDDGNQRPYPFDPTRKTEYIRQARAEREFLAHAIVETGTGASPEEIARQSSERSVVRAQSHELARRLDFAGKTAYRKDAFFLWTYWVHSKRLDLIPNFRRICLLPYIAAIVRASKLAALEYFIKRKRFCRFWTFTTGERCGLGDLRARCRWLHKRLSRLNAYLRGKYGVELAFRSTEFGTLEFDDAGNRREGLGGAIEYDANGEPLFHVHAHVVVNSLVGFIAPAKWSAMFDDVWAFWGFNWDGGKKGGSGVIRDARECCKYVTKPGDMLKLSAEQLGRLHEAVFKLKLCQPMGSLAVEMRERRKAKKTLRRYRTREGAVWREVDDQNKHVEQSPEEREAVDNFVDAQRFAKEMSAAVYAPRPDSESVEVTTCWNEDSERFEKATRRIQPDHGRPFRAPERAKDWCRVFSRLSPAIGPSNLKEPRVIVGGTRFDRRAIEGHPLVSRLWAQTVQHWEAGLWISVHTGTPTVTDPPDGGPPDGSFECLEPQFLSQ